MFQKLLIPESAEYPDVKDIKIKTFQIINYLTFKGKPVANALTTSFKKSGNEGTVRISLFDLERGNVTMSKDFT